MNCPICGTPLGDGDMMCKNCGTKRSEMGAAYNNPAPSGSRYGGNYGGYGSNGGYGGNGYGNNGSYGNMGMGQSASPVYHKNSGIGGKLIGLIVVIVMVLIGGVIYYVRNNTPVTQKVGDITVIFPQPLKKGTDRVFALTDADGGEFYHNNKLAFAYMKFDLEDLGMSSSDISGFESAFMTEMHEQFEHDLKGYQRKDQLGEHLRFYFTNEGTKFFADMKLENHDESLYMYITYCRASDEGKYITKMRKMFDSIKYN
ncbi:zinc ribbon domain-containing protein [Ruminococcus sp.]|uniref:zinc ribbon domain-containing protein n=1 Tax=Ruminococcus sp. TaxID=41978 RepID=UPI0025E47145|nr:zinc ribbon domain-containing protein [Ruminococcus sp.]MBQ8965813.1 zinc ribbon domain-containing protein [Ruminococcus sp.]